MFKFKHYGVEVVYQECEPGEFEALAYTRQKDHQV